MAEVKLKEIAARTRCTAEYHKRDTYRYSGRGPSGFTMHYKRCQCKRMTSHPSGKCWQHQDGVLLRMGQQRLQKHYAKLAARARASAAT